MKRLTAVGVGLLVGSIALGALTSALMAATGGDAAPFALFFGSLSGPMFLAGLVCLIVSAVRGRGQQQQQQVVIYTQGGHAGAVQVRCPDCGTLNAEGDRFCMACGQPVAPIVRAASGSATPVGAGPAGGLAAKRPTAVARSRAKPAGPSAKPAARPARSSAGRPAAKGKRAAK